MLYLSIFIFIVYGSSGGNINFLVLDDILSSLYNYDHSLFGTSALILDDGTMSILVDTNLIHSLIEKQQYPPDGKFYVMKCNGYIEAYDLNFSYFHTDDIVNFDISNGCTDRSVTNSFKIIHQITNIHDDYNYFNSINNFLTYIPGLGDYCFSIKWTFYIDFMFHNKYIFFRKTLYFSKPKNLLFTMLLLLICGDTGALINPGPMNSIDSLIEQTQNNFQLSVVDPDINHFSNNIKFDTHTTDSFLKTNVQDEKDLKIFHNNARSLLSPGRIDEYLVFLKSLKSPFDILVFTETWLMPDNIDCCKIDGYHALHLTRPCEGNKDFKTRGGGVSIFINDKIAFKTRNDISIMEPFMECLVIELNFNNSKYLIGGIYRPPNADIHLFTDKFNRFCEPLKSSYKLVLLGDFNVDLLNNNSNKTNFELCMQSNYLIPTILAATRVSLITNNDGSEKRSDTLIDNIFINQQINFNSGLIQMSITDHYPIYIILPDLKIKNAKPIKVNYREINDYSQRTFNSYLYFYQINEILNDYLAESAYTKFFSIFQASYDKSFPLQSKFITHKDEVHPWITESHLREMTERDKLCKLSKKNKIEKKTYSEFRNKLKERLRKDKCEYYTKLFEYHKSNIKKTWNVINKVINSNVSRSKISLNDHEGNEYKDNEIPSKFINYFTSIAKKMTENITRMKNSPKSYLLNRSEDDFYMTPVCPNEVNLAIDGLTNNGNSPNSISTSVIKNSKHILTPIMCHLINLFVEQGYFPNNLKSGCITPIYKGGDSKNVNNYRPVCSLSPLSKIIEKVVANRMIDFLEDFDIFSTTQFGFRKNMGTETALINYIDYIQKQLDNRKYVISIFWI